MPLARAIDVDRRRQGGQALGQLLLALLLGGQGPGGRLVLRLQGCSALLALQQRRALGLQLLGQLRLPPPTGHQALAQLQQAPAQRFGLVALGAAAKAELATALLQAAAGHGAALLQQLPVEGHRPAAAQFTAGAAEIAKHQGVSEHVAKHLGVDRLVAHQVHGPPHQAPARGIGARGAGRFSPPQGGGIAGAEARGAGARGAGAVAAAADLVQRQKGEPTGAAALEQLDGAGGDAVVVHHHLAEAGAGRHLQGQAVLLLHLPQLGDRAMDTFEAGLQQHAQGAGATALLEGFAAAIEAGDLPLQLGLLLLQAAAGALLQGQGCRQLLEPGLLPGQVYFQLLPFPFGQLRLLGGAATGIGFAGLFGAEFQLALAVLSQPFQQLLQFGLQRRQALAELLALLAALALLLQPAAAAVGHLPQAPAGEVDGRFCIAAGGLGGLQGLFVVVGLEQLQLLTQLGLLAGQLLALALQGFRIQLVLFRLAGQFAGPGLQTGQFGLHGQQLIFSKGLHLSLQLFEQGGGGGDFAFLHQQLRLALLLLLL